MTEPNLSLSPALDSQWRWTRNLGSVRLPLLGFLGARNLEALSGNILASQEEVHYLASEHAVWGSIWCLFIRTWSHMLESCAWIRDKVWGWTDWRSWTWRSPPGMRRKSSIGAARVEHESGHRE
jgi:hypothetical protein